MRAIFSLVSVLGLSLFLVACGLTAGANVNVNVNANGSANANAKTNANAGSNTTPTNANSSANASANAATAPSGPKRISFAKGADWSSENLTLAPGQSKQFVISADDMQYLTVDTSSHDIKVLMITKKNAKVEEEGSSLAVHLGAKADYVFEVRNPGSKEVKTSIKVQVINEGD